MEKVTTVINKFGIAIVMLFAAGVVVYAQGTFVAPTQAPPGGNTDAPINVGISAQIKNGGLGVNSLAVFNDAVVRGSVDVTAGYRAGGVPGIARTCTNGKVLTDAIVSGGILTGGTCTDVGASGGGGGGAAGTVVSMYSTTYNGYNCTGSIYGGGGSCPAGTQTIGTACFPNYCISSGNCIPGTRIFYCVR